MAGCTALDDPAAPQASDAKPSASSSTGAPDEEADTGTLPGVPSTEQARTELAGLHVAPHGSMSGYSRDKFLHWAERYSRRLRRDFYLSAQTSIIREGPNKDFYLKKRGEGCKHVQAVIALARRRASVLWALLRDNRVFAPLAPARQ